VAVRNAHLYADARRRASFQEALTHCAETLVSTLEPEEIARRLVDAYTEMTGARACIIGLFDSERATLNALASRGLRLPAAPIPLTAVPRHILERAWKGWEQARVPLEFGNDPWFHEEFGGREAGAGWYLLSPLVAGERTPGCVLLGFAADHRLDAEGRSGVAALTSIASAAVERALLHRRLERRTRELDALYRASAALTEGADVPAMLEELNALLEVHGVRVVSVAFRDERLARRLRAEPLTTAERDALRGRCGWESVAEDWAAVPMPLGRRIFGVLRVEPRALAPWQRTFLGTIAHGLAEVAQRDDLRTSVELAATERALVEERDRMASDLHDTVGQVFVAIGLLIGARRERLDPANAAQALLERLADLAERGKWEIDQAARALAFVPALRRGLVDSARSLAADVEGDSGLRIRVRVTGRVARLDGVTERALYRVAHEGIANAWRHAQCTSVGVHLRFEDDDVTLRVDDDGAGAPDSLVEGSGIAGMRKALKECGGDLVIETAPGAGLALEARVPRTAP
jgi:signal transduction histidine kinase